MEIKELTVEQLQNKINELQIELDKKDSTWDFTKSWEEYCLMREPEVKIISELDRRLRLISPYKLNEIHIKDAPIMSIDEFIKCVKDGGFMDYDGFGLYVKDGKESDIEIYPSDVKNKSIREDFKEIIWFNK